MNLLVLFLGVFSQSATYINPDFGFKISVENQNWYQAPLPGDQDGLLALFRGPLRNNKQPTLTVRKDRLGKHSLKSYVGYWIKKYPGYGIDVLGSKVYRLGNRRAYVIDSIARKEGRMTRQLMTSVGRNVLIMTCVSDAKFFNEDLKACNQIFKSYEHTPQTDQRSP